MPVRVRLFAAAREAVGAAELELEVPAGASARELLGALAARASAPDAARVLAGCSLLADGVARADLDAALGAVAAVDVLPPFAGG